MDTQAIEREAHRLHSVAKDGSVIVDGVKYALTFNGHNYDATEPDGSHVATFNTRKVTVARKWLREYLEQ